MPKITAKAHSHLFFWHNAKILYELPVIHYLFATLAKLRLRLHLAQDDSLIVIARHGSALSVDLMLTLSQCLAV